MGIEPLRAPEQGAKRQGNLPVLIAFGTGRKRTRITQDVAAVLDQFRSSVERLFQRHFTSNRRHGGHPFHSQRSPGDAGDCSNLHPDFLESLVNIGRSARFVEVGQRAFSLLIEI